MFHNAAKFVIAGGTFNALHNTHHHHITRSESDDLIQRGWERLSYNITCGAFHDPADQYDPPRCHPGTRDAVLNKILNWLRDSDKPSVFMWLYGPAGSGKSAIARTIAEKCREAGTLAATFFFSRTARDRNNEKLLVPTLSYQLCTSIPQMRNYVGEVIYQDPSILGRSLDVQMEELIVGPLNSMMRHEGVAASIKLCPKLIIIDGLDECSDGNTQRKILNTFSEAIHRLNIPLFCLVASRPEHHIRLGFNSKQLRSRTIRLALDNDYAANDDIRIFLMAKFEVIRKEHPSGAYLPHIWPTKEELDQLLSKASGQFIYASTILKYIESYRHRPDARLATILSLSSSQNDMPFSELDALYCQILSSVDNIKLVLEVLGFIILRAQMKIGGVGRTHASSFLETFFGYRPGDISVIFADMHSVVRLRESDSDLHLSLHHASLADFLLDETRSRGFFIDTEKSHGHLAQRWIHYSSQNKTNNFWVFANLVSHCTQASPTTALLTDLRHMDFCGHFSKFTIREIISRSFSEYLDTYLDWLYSLSISDTGNDRIFLDQLNLFDKWVESTLLKYPIEIQRVLAAVMTMQGFQEEIEWSQHILDIFRPKKMRFSEILSIDEGAFIFTQGILSRNPGIKEIVYDYLLDPSRAGVNYVDETTYSELASKLIEFLFENEKGSQHYDYNPHATKLAFVILSSVLPKASRDSALAERLQSHALEFSNPSSFYSSREILSAAAQVYIKDVFEFR